MSLSLSRTSNRAHILASTDYQSFLEREKKLWMFQALARIQRRQFLTNNPWPTTPNLGEGLKGKTGTSIASSGYELLDNHEIFSQHESLIYPYHHDNLSSSTSSATYSQPSKLSSQSSATSLPDPFEIQKAPLMECTSHLTKSTFEDLIELIDASTRDLLFGHKMFGRSGISQPSDEEHPTLCRLAPGVFCPNYSKVSYRLSGAFYVGQR